MALTTPTQFAVILATLTLNSMITKSESADPRLAEELKCLSVSPGDQCNLAVTYPPPLNTLQCGQVVPESADQILSQAPTLKMTQMTQPISKGLLLMFDPDAPVSNQPQDGIIHWLAQITVNNSGDVQIVKVEKDYHQPSPPKGQGPHRYQLFLFQYNSNSDPVVGGARQFQLCPFIKNNTLSQPVVATQYIFEHK